MCSLFAFAPVSRYQQVFDQSTAAQLVVDPTDGRVMDANQAACDFYREGRKAIIGHSLHELAPMEPAELTSTLEVAAIVGAHLTGIQLRDASGAERMVEVYASPVTERSQTLLHLIIFDVTERMRVLERERELHAERVARAVIERAASEWQGTFDAIELPILLVDQRGSVARVNLAAAALIGAQPGDLAGRRLSSLSPTRVWRAASDQVKVAVAHGHAGLSRIRDGDSTWEISATRFVPPGEPTLRVIVVARDLTPMTRLQEELQRQETLSRMGVIVAGVAHEVRNPLFAISSSIDALKAKLGQQPEFARYAPKLQAQVDRLSRLMADLLDYGRPQALSLAPCRVDDLLEMTVDQTRELAVQRGVHVVTRNRAGAEVSVHVDRHRFMQVIQNLVANAIQHAPEHSAVDVECQARTEIGRQAIIFSVRDRGPGIPADDLTRVFEPFFTRRNGGTGLGLALAHRVVHDHGGSIAATNHAEGGAVLSVELPFAH